MLRAEVSGPSGSVDVDIDTYTPGKNIIEFTPQEEGKEIYFFIKNFFHVSYHIRFLQTCFAFSIKHYKIGWMDNLQFYVLFNSISVISGWWQVDNERLCAVEPCLRLRRFCLQRGITKKQILLYSLERTLKPKGIEINIDFTWKKIFKNNFKMANAWWCLL